MLVSIKLGDIGTSARFDPQLDLPKHQNLFFLSLNVVCCTVNTFENSSLERKIKYLKVIKHHV